MPALFNYRQERFAQCLAEGKTADEAYKEAGYTENRGNATRLKANEVIKKRVAELLGDLAVKAEVTVESLVAELDKVLAIAVETRQVSGAVAAIKEKAVLLGLRVEKSERTNKNEPRQLTDEQLDSELAAIRSALGRGRGEAGRSALTH